MAGWRWEEDVVRQADVLDVTSRQRALNFEPGAEFLYSNTGYTLLAVVVRRVTGQSLRQFTEARIFAPLGMTATGFQDDHTALVRNRAHAYVRGEDGGYRVISYAAGLTHGVYRGHATVGHGGADAGYRAEFLRFPDRRLSVAVLCNFPSSDPDRLVRGVADVYLEPGADEDASVPVSPPSAASDGQPVASGLTVSPRASPVEADETLEDLTGFYRREESDTPLHLVVREGVLALLSGGSADTLVPIGPDRFRLGESSTVGTFDRSDGVATLRLSGPVEGTYRQQPRWRPSAGELAPFAGTYYSVELEVQYTLAVDDGRLVARQRRLGTLRLTPTYPDGFFTSGFYLAFTQGADGAVDGFTMSTARAWKVRFDRQ